MQEPLGYIVRNDNDDDDHEDGDNDDGDGGGDDDDPFRMLSLEAIMTPKEKPLPKGLGFGED